MGECCGLLFGSGFMFRAGGSTSTGEDFVVMMCLTFSPAMAFVGLVSRETDGLLARLLKFSSADHV